MSSFTGTMLVCMLTAVNLFAVPAVDSSGRNSHFWITLRPTVRKGRRVSNGTMNVQFSNGYRSVTDESPLLSCKRVLEDSTQVYQITWTGNDLIGSPAADTLKVSVAIHGAERVELRDVTVNGVTYSDAGLQLESEFTRQKPRLYQGKKSPKGYFLIAGSIVLRDPKLRIEDPQHPFSDLRNGHTLGPTPYASSAPEKLKSFPAFSWDKVPRGMLIRKRRAYTDSEIRAIAENYDLVVLEKANGAGKGSCSLGMRDTGSRLKKINPDITVLFYWNSRIYFGHYGIDSEITKHRDEWIHPTFVIRGRLPTYVRENPDFLKWWVGCAEKMIRSPSIDGTFVDKAGVPIYMLDALYKATPANKLVMNNNSSARKRIGYVDGTYREGWSGGGNPETIAETIAIARETGLNRKMQILRMPCKRARNPREMEDGIDRGLAIYLLFAEKYSYFYWQKTVDGTDPLWMWDASYVDQLNRPLGSPLGPYVRDNRVYTRSFEHCDVYLDLGSGPGGYKTRVLWKNNIGNTGVLGRGMSSTDNTYTIQGGGGFGGTKDHFYFLSDAHYGDGLVRASVDSLENTHEHAKAGIMFRESLAPDARMVAMLRDPAGRLHMYCRSERGGELLRAKSVNAPQHRHLVLIRKGDSFVGACSADGKKWSKLAQVSIPMREKIEMGMAVASHSRTTLAEATFSSLKRTETSRTVSGDEIEDDPEDDDVDEE